MKKEKSYKLLLLVSAKCVSHHTSEVCYFHYFTYYRHMCRHVFLCACTLFLHKKKKEMYIVGRVICGSHLWHLFSN